MADNFNISQGSGTAIAADDISSVYYQRVKIAQGADGVGVDVSSSAPLQVTLANTGANATPVVVDLGANNDVTVTSGTVAATQSGTWTVQPGNTANTTPWLTAPTAMTSGGASYFKSIDLDESEEQVKATAGQLYGGVVINLSASVLYLKIYNDTAANVSVGTTVPDLTIPIPTAGSTNGAGFVLPFPACGVAFSSAITVACTTGIADNSAGAPGANECVVSLFYK